MNHQLFLFDDQELPAHQPVSTSREAARRIVPHTETLRRKVLDFLRRHGPATDDEMQRGIPMGGNTQRPRRRELEKAGAIERTDEVRKTGTGRNAVVFRAK